MTEYGLTKAFTVVVVADATKMNDMAAKEDFIFMLVDILILISDRSLVVLRRVF